MAVLTISRQTGSLGTEIAQALQDEFKWKFLDKESLEVELVEKYGIPEKSVERYDEKKPAFWEMFSSDKDRYLHFMKTVMYEFARNGNGNGNCIIIGRGGQVLFHDIPGVLTVRVIAPTMTRIERLKTEHGYHERLAEQIIRHSDHDRAGFHKFFFHVNWDDSHLYDLVLNTARFRVEEAVDVMKHAIEATGIKEQQAEKDSKLADLCLGQEVVTQIAYREKIPVQFLEAIAVSGIVTLRGSTLTTEDIHRCEAVAQNVPGVKEVINEVYYIPHTYGMT